MLLKMRKLSKLSLTDLTSVWFDTKMDSCVLGEVGAVGKSLSTSCTLVWFWFSQMDLGVKLKVCFTGKALERK